MKMNKLISVLLLIFCLTLAIAPAVHAADLELVADYAELLTDDQWAELNDRAEMISEQYQCEVAIVTVEDPDDGDAYEYAKSVYQEYNYGYGGDKSGVMLFLNMKDSANERACELIAFGFGNTAFTDHGKNVMLDDYIVPQLSNDQYYQAFTAYLDKSEEYLKMARDGSPFDKGTSAAMLIKLAITIFLPILIALIMCSIWKAQMKTAKIAKAADNYIPANGFRLTGQADQFLYRTTTRRKIETSSSSSGGTTRDSSGFSGSGRKF